MLKSKYRRGLKVGGIWAVSIICFGVLIALPAVLGDGSLASGLDIIIGATGLGIFAGAVMAFSTIYEESKRERALAKQAKNVTITSAASAALDTEHEKTKTHSISDTTRVKRLRSIIIVGIIYGIGFGVFGGMLGLVDGMCWSFAFDTDIHTGSLLGLVIGGGITFIIASIADILDTIPIRRDWVWRWTEGKGPWFLVLLLPILCVLIAVVGAVVGLVRWLAGQSLILISGRSLSLRAACLNDLSKDRI
jgi:hypothetical protein